MMSCSEGSDEEADIVWLSANLSPYIDCASSRFKGIYYRSLIWFPIVDRSESNFLIDWHRLVRSHNGKRRNDEHCSGILEHQMNISREIDIQRYSALIVIQSLHYADWKGKEWVKSSLKEILLSCKLIDGVPASFSPIGFSSVEWFLDGDAW